MRNLLLFTALLAPCLSAYVYKYDDGTAEFSTLGMRNGILAVGYQATAPNTMISGMRFWNFWGTGNGHAISYHLWGDPDNDGVINNPVLLQTVNTTINAPGPGGNWQEVVFPSTTAFNDGDWFYVGISFYDPTLAYFLGGNDRTSLTNGLSWMITFPGPGPGNTANFAGGTISNYGTTTGLTGVLMIRALTADETAAPEPGTAALAAVGVLAMILRARR
jgi:hypothetical protein